MIAVLLEKLLECVGGKRLLIAGNDRKNLKSEFLRVAAIARLTVGCVSRDGETSA